MDIEIFKIQNKIYKLLNPMNGISVHFNTDDDTLSLFSFNPSNDEFFLIKKMPIGAHEYNCYCELLVYVENLIHCINKNEVYPNIGLPHTIIWNRIGGETHTSYFYGDNVEDVLRKFFYGKETIKHLFNIQIIKQNPIS